MSADNPKERDSDLKQSFKMLEEMLRDYETNHVDISESHQILASLLEKNKQRLKEGWNQQSDAN